MTLLATKQKNKWLLFNHLPTFSILNTSSDIYVLVWYGYHFIGGFKNQRWQWQGLVTGPMPANGDPESEWKDGQPEDNDENCAALLLQTYSFGWNDIPCTSTRYYICETNE